MRLLLLQYTSYALKNFIIETKKPFLSKDN